MTAGEYLTIDGPGHAHTRVLGSRFLGTASPLENEESVAPLLDAERKRYHDATHLCYAFRVGTGSTLIEKSADAGEPHGTAGLPILREIRKRDLTNCLVIVTRYFGGTKLGTGRLARSYSDCAALCLESANTVRRIPLSRLGVVCPYELQSIVYALAHRHHAAVEVHSLSGHSVLELVLPLAEIPSVSAALSEAGGGRIIVSEIIS